MNNSEWLQCQDPRAMLSYLINGKVCEACQQVGWSHDIRVSRTILDERGISYRDCLCQINVDARQETGATDEKLGYLAMALLALSGKHRNFHNYGGFSYSISIRDGNGSRSVSPRNVTPLFAAQSQVVYGKHNRADVVPIIRSIFHYGPIPAETSRCDNCQSECFVARHPNPTCSCCGETVATCFDGRLIGEMIKSAYDERQSDGRLRNDTLAILADALEDNGFFMSEILEQLRDPSELKYMGLWSLHWLNERCFVEKPRKKGPVELGYAPWI